MIRWLKDRLSTRAALLAELEIARQTIARLDAVNAAQLETIAGRDDVITTYREAHEALRATARATYAENMVVANSLTDPKARGVADSQTGAENGTGGR